jgi:hypothetical protein
VLAKLLLATLFDPIKNVRVQTSFPELHKYVFERNFLVTLAIKRVLPQKLLVKLKLHRSELKTNINLDLVWQLCLQILFGSAHHKRLHHSVQTLNHKQLLLMGQLCVLLVRIEVKPIIKVLR